MKILKPQILFNRMIAGCMLSLLILLAMEHLNNRLFPVAPTVVILNHSIHANDIIPDEAESLVECTSWIVYNLMTPTANDHPYITPEEAYTVANETIYWMLEYDIPLDDLHYVLSLYYAESNFDPLAKNSKSTASGIGQLLSTHWVEVGDPFEIEFNISKSFELINAAYAHSEGSQYDKWMTVYLQYCGTRQGARNAMYQYNRFEQLIEDCQIGLP